MKTKNMNKLIDSTRSQLGFTARTAPGFDEPISVIKRDPVVSASFNLREEEADISLLAFAVDSATMVTSEIRALGVVGGAGTALYSGNKPASGQAIDIKHAFDLFKTTPAVARAGAIVREFLAPKGRLVKSDVAGFALLADDATAPDAGLEFGEFGTWDLGDPASVPSYGCTVTVTRKLEKLAGSDTMEAMLQQALILGAVKVVDQVVQAAIIAARPAGAAPTVAGLVSAGCELTNVRAIVGKAAHSAAQFVQGAPYFAGVPAMGSDLLNPAAIVGDFSSVVVFVDPALRVISKRLDATGRFEMTAFISVKPFLLEPGRLFTVAGE